MKVYLAIEYAPQKQYIRHVVGIFTTQDKAEAAILSFVKGTKAQKRCQVETRFLDYAVDEASNEVLSANLLQNPESMRRWGWREERIENPWEPLRRRRPL